MTLKIGSRLNSNNCGEFIVIHYTNAHNVTIKFIETGTELIRQASQIRNGDIKDPMIPVVYGVGFIGIGKHLSKVNGKNTKAYQCWSGILRRCHSRSYRDYPRYGGRGVTVHKSWYNFQNFSKWYEENYKEGFVVDKDLRYPDAKEYSESTCEFIPHALNSLLITSNKTRGKYPVGVSFFQRFKKYKAQCGKGGKDRIFLGYFNTSEEAYETYKIYKEALIKEQAMKYYNAGDISEQIYKNLMEWVVVPYPE